MRSETLHTDGDGSNNNPALASGTTYYYRIRAMNAADDNDTDTANDGEGAWSADQYYVERSLRQPPTSSVPSRA